MYSPKGKRPKYLPKRKHKAKKRGRFHGTAVWTRMSKAIRNEGVVCRVCEHIGLYEPADATDHIIPLSKGGAQLDKRNLMPICNRHHEQKNIMESYGYSVDVVHTTNGKIPYDVDRVLDDLAKGHLPDTPDEGVGGVDLWI